MTRHGIVGLSRKGARDADSCSPTVNNALEMRAVGPTISFVCFFDFAFSRAMFSLFSLENFQRKLNREKKKKKRIKM